MTKKRHTAYFIFFRKLVPVFLIFTGIACGTGNRNNKRIETEHVKIFYETGKYGGWPANWGMWSWGNEILVGFTQADHLDKNGKSKHSFDRKSAIAKFARSIDGGKSWTIEDAFEAGIVEATVEHNINEKSRPATMLTEPVDFTHPDFALTFRMVDMYTGPSSFYYSYNRGRTWEGAFRLKTDFPNRQPAGIVTRTDYIIEGKHELTAFLTVGFRENDKKWREVACVRTTDGGKTWKFLSWIGPEKINSIMPSSVRLDTTRILTVIRRTKPPRMVSFLSEDNGYSWKQLNDPVMVDSSGNPPALCKLKDGRLCLVYAVREPETMPDGIGIYATFSEDEGQTWSEPVLIRGKDGAGWDIGYCRAVQLPDETIVAVYYYNNINAGDKFRYIAATRFRPE